MGITIQYLYMDTDDNKKITWTRSAKKDGNQSQNHQFTDGSGIDPVDMSTRAATHKGNQSSSNIPEDDINSLKGEIEQALSGDAVPTFDPAQQIVKARADDVVDLDGVDQDTLQKNIEVTPPTPPKPPVSPEPTPQPSVMDQVAQDNHEALVASLKEDIQSKIQQEPVIPPQSGRPTNTGIEQTYYSDLSKAMSSNEPATMSELIRKSRFEEKESKILSPKSKKNIAFIGGAVIFLILSIVILSSLFKGSDKVEFITVERVSSLVRSNLDTGINTTGIESARIKQAIRDVIEMKIPEDSINQIYYVEDNGLGNLRRLGIKDIFEKTGNKTPDLLYDNIENTFTHGVYRTNKNYPFIIMKALSYDRAFEGMLEWEPTMIDDLATYLDLPPEATDRSLIKDGFEDDLIQNKNVRVARFLPRDVDRRGLLEFLKTDDSETGEEQGDGVDTTEGEDLGFMDRAYRSLTSVISPPVFAQTEYTPEIVGGSFDNDNLTLIEVGSTVNHITSTKPICFDPVSGNRIEINEQNTLEDNPYAFCFEVYQCYRYRCYIGNTPVSEDRSDEPGFYCREVIEEGTVYHENDPRYVESVDGGPKSCHDFNSVLSIDHISESSLCFDTTGNLVGVGYASGNPNITCISPMNRQEQICIDRNQRIVPPNFPGPKICFEPLGYDLKDFNGSCSDFTTIEGKELLASVAFEIRSIAYIAGAFGLSAADVQNLNEAADVLDAIAYGDILQSDAIFQAILITQELEFILETIDPNLEIPIIGANGGLNLYGHLRAIISIINCTFGIGNGFNWLTLAPVIQTSPIYAGQATPTVTTAQQVFVLIGLMDPVSVTGVLDLVTQDAISQFQTVNGLSVTGILDVETLTLLQNIIDAQGTIYGDEAILNDYFIVTDSGISSDGLQILMLGAFNNSVQNLEVVLFVEGYDVVDIDGLFDENTCLALQEFQEDQGLDIADPTTCVVSAETLEVLNDTIRAKQYLGSGFIVNQRGIVEGVGAFTGIFGPGVNFGISEADANSLNEGDIVLMYMFLDEETILITRDQIVINEVIKRRALEDIFK